MSLKVSFSNLSERENVISSPKELIKYHIAKKKNVRATIEVKEIDQASFFDLWVFCSDATGNQLSTKQPVSF